MKGKYCKVCGGEIEPARLNATNSNAVTCIAHMNKIQVARKAGFMVRDHKMAGQIEIHDDPEIVQALHRKASRHGYGVSSGVKVKREAKTQSGQL